MNERERKFTTCRTRLREKNSPRCGLLSVEVRSIEAAPGLWIRVPLCPVHVEMWDQALGWGGARVHREANEILAGQTYKQIRDRLLRSTLELTGNNRKAAAVMLGVGERTVYRWIEDLDE